MPKRVDYYVSDDGIEFILAASCQNDVPEQMDGVVIKEFMSGPVELNARYVRIHAISLGHCPSWHKGYEYKGKAFIFADEISIK